VLALRNGDGVASRHAPVPTLPFQDRLLRGHDGRVLSAGPLAHGHVSEERAIEIRQVEAGEWRQWREVRLRMLRDDADFFSTRYDDMVREPDATWRTWVADAAVGDEKTLFIAEEQGRWLGVVGAFVRVNALEVQLISMWVDPGARGRGVAQRLIRAVAQWASGRRATRVVLFVQEANTPAQRLYERAGFRLTGDRAPAAGGRSAFKLVLAASVGDLLA
jgi:ribosomal protein S18 acetylase RimI-like enzyme